MEWKSVETASASGTDVIADKIDKADEEPTAASLIDNWMLSADSDKRVEAVELRD